MSSDTTEYLTNHTFAIDSVLVKHPEKPIEVWLEAWLHCGIGVQLSYVISSHSSWATNFLPERISYYVIDGLYASLHTQFSAPAIEDSIDNCGRHKTLNPMVIASCLRAPQPAGCMAYALIFVSWALLLT